MKFTEQKFDLMLESAWRGFESTLMLHGMSREEVELFNKYMSYRSTKFLVEDELSQAVEWEEME